MNYRQSATDLLKRKKQLEAAVRSLELQAQILESDAASCKSPTFSLAPTAQHGFDNCQDRLVAILSKADECQKRKKIVLRELEMIEIGMSVLNDYQRDLLDCFFIDRKRGAADDLCAKYYKERSCLYDDRKKAIDAFTIAVFGVLEI